MKFMRLAMCVAVFAVIGGSLYAEDMDIRALQAKLAAQEARLNDLQAKMNYSGSGDVEGVVSIRKNAVVTIGGTVNTRFFRADGNVKSALPGVAAGNPNAGRDKVIEFNYSDLKVSDAKVRLNIDVNEYFDAHLQMDLHDQDTTRAGHAQKYYIRWKNVCNTGFGLIVGRNDFIFGDGNPAGERSGMLGGSDDIAYFDNSIYTGFDAASPISNDLHELGTSMRGEGMFIGSGQWLAHHTGWDHNRTTQINPYWESQDGKFKAEVSFFQGLDRLHGKVGATSQDRSGGYRDYKSFDHSPASVSTRLTWKPIEGLKLTASFVNFHTNVDYNSVPGFRGTTNNGGLWGLKDDEVVNAGQGRWGHANTTSNNSALFLGFQYRPCFFNKLNVWGRWTHGWNEGWIKDMDSDNLNFGFSYDFTDQFRFFAQADFLRVKNKNLGQIWYKNNAWASYVGVRYNLPYGVNMELGWRHEESKFKSRGGWTHTKVKGDIIYGQLGFNF